MNSRPSEHKAAKHLGHHLDSWLLQVVLGLPLQGPQRWNEGATRERPSGLRSASRPLTHPTLLKTHPCFYLFASMALQIKGENGKSHQGLNVGNGGPDTTAAALSSDKASSRLF